MDDLLFKILIFAALGSVSGFGGGLLGIGGSMIRIPIFVHLLPFFGVASEVLMHVSLGTSMALILPSSILATYKQYQLGNLDLDYYRTWTMGILAGVLVGLSLLPRIPSQVLQIIFLVFILCVAVYVGFFDTRVKMGTKAPQGNTKLAVAAGVGCISALTGTGGGITTPIMRAFTVPMKHGIALSSATGIVVSAIGTLGVIISGWHVEGLPQHSLGFVDPVVWIAMMPTILLATPLGVQLANRLNPHLLKRIYVTYLFIAAIDLGVTALRS
jgi:uncharacterized membrane protein YfcA